MRVVIDSGSLRFDRFRIGDCQRLSQAFGTIFTRAWSSREMERVNVVRSILFDHRDDVLTQTRQERRDRDRGHHADHDSEHGEKAAKLMTRTLSSAIFSVSRKIPFGRIEASLTYVACVRARIGSSRAALNAG